MRFVERLTTFVLVRPPEEDTPAKFGPPRTAKIITRRRTDRLKIKTRHDGSKHGSNYRMDVSLPRIQTSYILTTPMGTKKLCEIPLNFLQVCSRRKINKASLTEFFSSSTFKVQQVYGVPLRTGSRIPHV